MNDLIIFAILGVQIFTGIIVIFLFLSFQASRQQKDVEQDKALDEARKKAEGIIQSAIKESQQIVKKAQSTGQTILAQEKEESDEITDEYQKELEKLSKEMVSKLESSEKLAETQFQDYLKGLESTIEAAAKKSEEAFNQRSATFFDKTSEAVGQAVAEINTKVKEEVTTEMKKMKDVVEEYQRKRMAVVDDNLIDIIEKTAAAALNKSLSMEEHVELIYKSLDEAKKKNFFGE